MFETLAKSLVLRINVCLSAARSICTALEHGFAMTEHSKAHVNRAQRFNSHTEPDRHTVYYAINIQHSVVYLIAQQGTKCIYKKAAQLTHVLST